MDFHLKSVIKTRIADTETPVRMYLKLRDRFPETLLMEHAERSHSEGGCSYICCDPIAGIQLVNNMLTQRTPGGDTLVTKITDDVDVADEIDRFIKQFTTDEAGKCFATDGLFGYFSYNAIQYFEDVVLAGHLPVEKQIPDIKLSIYRYIVVFDHFKNEISVVHFYTDERDFAGTEIIETFLNDRHVASYPFKVLTEERSNFTDDDFLKVIEQGRKHCYRGDVFQIVLSREFEISFSGDELNVYRALRSVNPSPYLFFFDYGSYRLFGSSPEAQLKIKDGKATLHPIAGTYRRIGDAFEDEKQIKALLADEKENAEHVMLIDLARNDLSKNYRTVEVPVYKNIQQFSHVLHLVSEVTGEEQINNAGPVKKLADVFPAGTLSGAPKHKAMQLIDKYENSSRGFYGGSIGYVGFNGDFNQAIMIRSFMSKNNKLYYRAGAGVVAASEPHSELAEVNNKIAALRKAIHLADSFEK